MACFTAESWSVLKKDIYVTSFGNAVHRLLRRTLVRSEHYSAF